MRDYDDVHGGIVVGGKRSNAFLFFTARAGGREK